MREPSNFTLPPENYQEDRDGYGDDDHPDELLYDSRAGNARPEHYADEHEAPVEVYSCEERRKREGEEAEYPELGLLLFSAPDRREYI